MKWQKSTPAQLLEGIKKRGLLNFHGKSEYTVYDLGGAMRCSSHGPDCRQGGNSCILRTMGALLCVDGYCEEQYLHAARTEFQRTNVTPEQLATNQMYSQQLAGTGKMMLNIVGHVGLPAGVALVVIQSFDNGRVKMIIFTDGKPRRLVFAFIEGAHIMPMVPTTRPFGETWGGFAATHDAWKASGGQVQVEIVKRDLPELVRGAASSLITTDRVGGAGFSPEDEELRIELGGDRAMCVPYDDETAGAATLARITEQLNALVSTLSKAMGLDQSAPRLEAYLSGKLQAETDVWVWSPVVKQYYDARSRMARLYATHYDEHTISFGDFLWDRAGSAKRPYPIPHLLKSLVHGLHAVSGQYASGLLAAVIRRLVTPEDAARLIAMTLCEGDEHNYPGPPVYPSDDTKDKLAATLGSTMGVMSDHVLAVVLTHVVAQSLPEWQQRLAGGATHEAVGLLTPAACRV